jgi:hypothetical protein
MNKAFFLLSKEHFKIMEQMKSNTSTQYFPLSVDVTFDFFRIFTVCLQFVNVKLTR